MPHGENTTSLRILGPEQSKPQGDRYARRSVHAATRHRESLKLPTTRAPSFLHRPPFFLPCRATPIGSRARLICRGSVRSTEAGYLFQLARITRCRGDGLPRACGGMRTGMWTDDVWLTPGPLCVPILSKKLYCHMCGTGRVLSRKCANVSRSQLNSHADTASGLFDLPCLRAETGVTETATGIHPMQSSPPISQACAIHLSSHLTRALAVHTCS